jgi:cobalamin biosynthesis Mg chelatase CobN
MACFPVLAQAEESVGPVYTPEVPKVTGHTNPPQKDKSQAKSSDTGGATAPGDSGAADGSDGSESEEASGVGNPGSGGDGGTGEGSPADGSNAADKQGGTAQSPGSQAGKDANAESSSGDSSSPLVPILIAIAVLAAVSIGAVVYRQRRQRRGPGAQVSPKAS